MPKETVSSSVEPTQAEPVKSKTYTKWDIFNSKGFMLAPTKIKCWPLPLHPADEACKTAFIPTGDHVLDHVNGLHGGGFQFTCREGASKPWEGWKTLQKSGAEIQSIRCEVCDKYLDISVRNLKEHLRPHQGKFRGAYQAFKGILNFHIAFTPPPSAGDDDELQFDSDDE